MVEQYGYIVRQIDNEKTICLNDRKLVSTVEGINRMGVYVKDDKLYYDGILLVQPDSNVDTNDTISLNTDGTFGGINLDTQGNECINITIADYNKLLRNERVDGYKPYNKYDVYNLVDDVENAEPVYYTETDDGYLFGHILWREKKNVIYNNVVGVLTPSDYSVNFENNLFNTDCPLITISYFNPIVVTGENILLEYRVSDLHDSVLNYDTIGPRYDKDNNIIETGIYKVIIRTEDGDEVTKYTYAGNILIETPTFNVLTPGKDRETWFSVQVIDSRGVASVEHFLNVYVRAQEYQANYLQVTDKLLRDFGITYDGDANDNVSAYKNKQAFSNLFAYAKDMSKNGVKLPKHDYYLDYHANINTSPDEPVVPDISTENSFTFYHFSDIHGSSDSVNKVQQLLEDNANAKFAILTGDYCNGYGTTTPTNSAIINAITNLSQTANGKFLVLNGNHDRWDGFGGNSSSTGTNASKAATSLLHDLLGNNVEWGDNSAAPVESFWYKDYAVANDATLRIVGIDSYAYINGHNAPRYKSVYSQAQVDWFIKCLKGSQEDNITALTENDYLLVAMHEPPVESLPSPDESVISIRGHYNWCSSRLRSWASSEYNGSLFPMIVDAYLRKSSIDTIVRNVAEETTTSMSPVEIYETFVDEPCTFLGYLCGHVHADIFHSHPEYPNQLIMCIDCGNADMNLVNDVSDIRERDNGILINEVTLNFDDDKINIHRIGNNTTTSYTINKAGSNKWDAVDVHDDKYVYPSVVRTDITFPFKVDVDETISPLIYLKGSKGVDLGSQTYYYVELSGGKISKTPEVITIEDIINDTKKIFRYPTGTGFDEIETIANQVDSNGDSPILYIGDDKWYSIQDKNAIAYLKNNVLYLKTYKKDVMALYNSNSSLGLDSVLNDRKLYLVHNTAEPTKYNLSMSVASYKKNNMYFPNNFTIDLNGSSFIAAYTDDIQEGSLVNFFDNIDTHIINGKFIGLYGRYDFLKAHINTARNVVGEHMHVCWNYRSKYCSFENLDISGAIGYDCSYDHGGMMGNAATTLTNNTYINARGIVTHTDEEIITTGSTSITSDYVSLGRTSKNKFVYCGKRHEVFASFYAGNGSFIKTIKSKLYDLIIVPKDVNGNRAASVVFTGYGIAKTFTADAKASDWVAAWKDNGNIAAGDPVLAIGCTVKDCFMHDTRTIAIGNPGGRQLLYDNITFTRCATTKYLGISSGGSITPLLGDFEDSWNWGKHISIRNCEHIKDSSQSSSSNITIYAGEHIEFKNNNGFSLKFGGMVEGGIIKDNVIRSWLIEKTRSCFHPHTEIKNNNINSLSVYVKPSDDVETHITEETAYDVSGTTEPVVEIDVTQIDTAYNDTIEPVIAMANCVFKKMIKYDYFKLRHCKVDTVAVDYIN